MQTLNMSNKDLILEETHGRREKRKIRKKIKCLNLMDTLKKYGVLCLLFVIIAQGAYILMVEIHQKNFIMNIEEDPYIPNSVVKRVLTHLR